MLHETFSRNLESCGHSFGVAPVIFFWLYWSLILKRWACWVMLKSWRALVNNLAGTLESQEGTFTFPRSPPGLSSSWCLELATHHFFRWRGVPSERNPAHQPSRRYLLSSRSCAPRTRAIAWSTVMLEDSPLGPLKGACSRKVRSGCLSSVEHQRSA